jgi:hypothetical protein
MTLPLTVQFTVTRQPGIRKSYVLLRGQDITFGRPIAGSSENGRTTTHVDILPAWIGARHEIEVSSVILRVAYYDEDGGAARVGWRTSASKHPGVIRFAVGRPGVTPAHPPADGSGMLHVRPTERIELSVLRLVGSQGFVPRLSVALTATADRARTNRPPAQATAESAEQHALGRLLREEWWAARRQSKDGALTWQRRLQTSVQLVDRTPRGELAERSSAELVRQGHPECTPHEIRTAWRKALTKLAEVVVADRNGSALHMLAVPGLAEYVAARRGGDGQPRLPAAEEQIRALARHLRALQWSTW